MTITNSSTRLFALATGVAVAIALMGAVAIAPAQAQSALTPAQVQAIVSLLSSFGADQATINNVTAALNGQPTSGNPSTPSTGGACPALSRDLQQGSTGADVMALQVYLNGSASTQVAVTGAGSPGNETQTFGPATKAAVIKFQSANGVSPAAGYVGPLTRAKIASLCGGSTPTTPTTGGSVVVGAAAQPVNSLAPAGANRVPFTTFTITNNSAAQVTVNSITVQRTGLGVDANFSGIVLVDQNGLQIGTAKTLNSNHQANLDGFVLNVGETKTLTVAGNISSSNAQSGQIVSLQVVAVNTGATVGGALPITGASQTINTTLTLGSVSTTTSSFDPGANQTKNIGDTGVRFSGLRFTAGSAEDIKLYSIRWRQVGTASAVDISNVMTVVEGTSYPTTVSSDGKYYTTVFPGGLLITKGNSIDAYVKGDLVGSNSASRTVAFDIDRSTDVYFIGQTYGYGVAVSGTYTPWYDGYTTTIAGGSATTIGKANEVAAQNIAVNVPNQPLGGFVTDFRGEAVSITGLVVNFNLSSEDATTRLLTSVSIVDQNGTVVAGPVDATDVAGTEMKATFTDTITFPVGRQVYTIKGRVDSDVSGGQTLTASTTPTGWTNPTGQTSGNTVTLSQTNFTMNAMTVKAAALTATVAPTPVSQNIVAGVQGFTFANVQLDATQSGENIRMSGIPLTLTVAGGNIDDLSSCQFFNGSSVLNTGGNVPSALSTSGSHTNFTFDNTLVIPKGTVVTLTIKCNVSTDATGTYVWSIDASDTMTATGVDSGASVNVAETSGSAGTMTVASGSLAVSVDPSSPSYTVMAGGQTGQTVSVLKLRASNEQLTLTKLGLTLTNTASSSSSDLTQVYIYDGATLVGTATFTGSNTSATSTLNTPVTLPKDQDKTLIVKADLADIGSSQPGTSGHLIAIDPLNAEATGASSGTTVQSGATAGVAGVRVFNSFPTVTMETLPSTGIADGRLMRFKVVANAQGSIGLGQFVFAISTTSATVTNAALYAYTDSAYSSAVSGQGTSGQIGSTEATPVNGTDFEIQVSSSQLTVPAGETRYFELRGSVTGVTTGSSVVTTLQGDAAFPSLAASTFMSQFATIDSGSNDDFIWSPNSTTTADLTSADWTNGYGVAGLPSAGLIQTRSN